MYAAIMQAGLRLKADQAVVDGEIVALDGMAIRPFRRCSIAARIETIEVAFNVRICGSSDSLLQSRLRAVRAWLHAEVEATARQRRSRAHRRRAGDRRGSV